MVGPVVDEPAQRGEVATGENRVVAGGILPDGVDPLVGHLRLVENGRAGECPRIVEKADQVEFARTGAVAPGDVPAALAGTLDAVGVANRMQGRSKYGAKRPKKA